MEEVQNEEQRERLKERPWREDDFNGNERNRSREIVFNERKDRRMEGRKGGWKRGEGGK